MMTGPAGEFLDAIRVLRHAAVGHPPVRIEDFEEGGFWSRRTLVRFRYIDGTVSASYPSLNALLAAHPPEDDSPCKYGRQILERAQGHLEDRLRRYLTGDPRPDCEQQAVAHG